MTFDEWWTLQPKDPTKPITPRRAWETATKAEREACAKVAEAAAMKIGDLGRQYRDDGNEESMDKCYAKALQCTQVAADIRIRASLENY